jgi:hypothetical protein
MYGAIERQELRERRWKLGAIAIFYRLYFKPWK